MLRRCLFALLLLGLPAVAHAAEVREWRFDVLLEDRPIGSQVFRLTEDGPDAQMDIEASFDVKILFFNAYSYRHQNQEVWQNDCLLSIRSTTDDNGKPFRVRGERESEGFVVDTGKVREILPSCVRSFAYWNPAYLRSANLLNSQTGEYEPVRVTDAGGDVLEFRGTQTKARRVSLKGPEFDIVLWYSSANDWLALESSSKGGRRLRYVRQ
jgi:hypothetical protein